MKKSIPLDDPLFEGMTDKMRVFVVEYAADMNQKRAAEEAGYRNPGMMGYKLMKREDIRKAVGALVEPRMEEADLSAKRVLKQIERFLFANLMEYVDKEGYLVCAPNELPKDIQQAIETYEVDTRYDKEGDIISTKHRIKMVSKIGALSKAIDYLGLAAPTEHNVTFDWDAFVSGVKNPPVDLIEAELKKVEVLDESTDTTPIKS